MHLEQEECPDIKLRTNRQLFLHPLQGLLQRLQRLQGLRQIHAPMCPSIGRHKQLGNHMINCCLLQNAFKIF